MKKLSNDGEYTEINLYKSYLHLPLAFNCARQVVFRAKYILDAEHQGVASEIMSFSRVLQTPERRLELHYKTRISQRNKGNLG